LPEAHSAAKAAIENRQLIAALKRCATQDQGRHRVFQQPTKKRKTGSLINNAHGTDYFLIFQSAKDVDPVSS
jgi:hypothetical protein